MGIFASDVANQDGSGDQRRTHSGAISVVAPGTRVEGSIETGGAVRVEGVVEGDIRAGQQVLVSHGGRVEGDVYTNEAIVGGQVTGAISANDRIELQSTAEVHGDITTPKFMVHEGGRFDGEIKMGSPEKLNRSPDRRKNSRSDDVDITAMPLAAVGAVSNAGETRRKSRSREAVA